MEKKILFWLECPESEVAKALWTVSAGNFCVAKAMPRERALAALDEYLEELEMEAR